MVRIHPLLAQILQVHVAPTYQLTQTIVEDRFERWLFTLLDDREYLPGGALDANRWERWHQVYRERSALQWWLSRAGTARVPELVRRAMGIALYLGPFEAWSKFAAKHVDKEDGDFTEPSETRSDLLWILSCAASHQGDIKTARRSIEEKYEVDIVKGLHADDLRRNAGLAIVGLVVAESLQVEGKLLESLEVRERRVAPDVEACREKFPYLDVIRLDGVADTCCRLALKSSGAERASYLARALEIRDAAYGSYHGMSFSRGIASALSGRSDVYYLLGRYDDAEKDIDRAIAMFDDIRELRWLPYTKLKKARVLLVRDRARYTTQAIATLYDALKGFEEAGTFGFAKYALAWLASIHEKEGQAERADECREKLVEWQKRLPGPEEWETSGLGFEINPTII